jgi:hypothetical protein
MRRALLFTTMLLAGCSDFDALTRGGNVDLGDARDLSIADDLAEPPDLLEPVDGVSPCANGVRDGNETDVDCGGRCGECDVGKSCRGNGDCQTGVCFESACSLATAPPFWLTIPPQSGTFSKRAFAAAATLPDGRLLFAGGYTDNNLTTVSNVTQTFTPSTRTWSASANLVEARAGAVAGITTDGTQTQTLYVHGGQQTRATERATPSANPLSWSRAKDAADANVTVKLGGAAGGVIGSLLYFTGGYVDTFATISRATGSFIVPHMRTAGPDLLDARAFHGTGTTPTFVLVFGGCSQINNNDLFDVTALASTERLDFGTTPLAWRRVAAMRERRYALAGIGGGDGRVYAIGGADVQGGALLRTVEAYDGARDRWVPVAPLAAARWGGSAAVGLDGRIYVAGGRASFVGFLDTIEAYGPVIQAGAATVASGTQLELQGNNFAASATVEIWLDQIAGAPIATTTSDATGAVAPFMVPITAAAGPHRLIARDRRSRFPAIVGLSVQ